ncbi:MAG TPA: DNA recombination protein RmuC, partial [Flavobacteriaceae bacterium]|nr:DNA recombination protein RmuC [Flavobacteriaceae bacterium]
LQEKFEKDFKLLAQDILKKNSDTFAKQNQDSIGNIIKPLEERIKQFEKQIHDTTKEDIDRHTTLREQIKSLRDLNIQISEEAVNLTKALKGDNKIQGNWGEMILERVLEKSGLEKGREYTTQEHFDTKEGRAIPDVVVHLPDKKHIIIDSKVSLTAYERYINEEEENLKEISLKQHIQSIENHVNQLSEKNYHNLKSVNSPGFVLLFIPIEPAFAAALNEQANLYTKAFDKNIIIVTPTTLLATLRTIDTMWTNEKQQQNALEIARRAGALYDTFVNLTEELQKLGRQMQTTDRTYNQVMVKLTGRNNLIQRVDKLKRLGAQTTKNIDSKLLLHGNSEEE